MEWQLQTEDYDYTQEVARAGQFSQSISLFTPFSSGLSHIEGFADMLHDEERVSLHKHQT